MENLTEDNLCPNDWKQLARTVLSGGNYLLWKADFYDLCRETARMNRAQQIPVTEEMLTGEGTHTDTQNQLGFTAACHAQTK